MRKFVEICNSWEQLGNLLRMRQISIETFRKEITRCSWLLYICECLFNVYDVLLETKTK
jgi:hypothetical protein